MGLHTNVFQYEGVQGLKLFNMLPGATLRGGLSRSLCTGRLKQIVITNSGCWTKYLGGWVIQIRSQDQNVICSVLFSPLAHWLLSGSDGGMT